MRIAQINLGPNKQEAVQQGVRNPCCAWAKQIQVDDRAAVRARNSRFYPELSDLTQVRWKISEKKKSKKNTSLHSGQNRVRRTELWAAKAMKCMDQSLPRMQELSAWQPEYFLRRRLQWEWELGKGKGVKWGKLQHIQSRHTFQWFWTSSDWGC